MQGDGAEHADDQHGQRPPADQQRQEGQADSDGAGQRGIQVPAGDGEAGRDADQGQQRGDPGQ
ncbi:hypothetical protein [Actinoplanes nipponensis]|uniref:hypothetical protein n=1 Tax=Actinoplanes nipponensis TaxID=135950 RepID=UPI0031E73A64